MEDDLALIRASGMRLSDEDTAQLTALRQRFAANRAMLDAVRVGEIELATVFHASSASPHSEADKEER